MHSNDVVVEPMDVEKMNDDDERIIYREDREVTQVSLADLVCR